MFGGKRTITCPGGEWTTVIQTRFAQIPVAWKVRMTADGNTVSGEFEETKSSWIFPGAPTTGSLQAEMIFARGYWNTFYLLRFKPAQAVTVTVERSFA